MGQRVVYSSKVYLLKKTNLVRIFRPETKRAIFKQIEEVLFGRSHLCMLQNTKMT